MGGVPELLEGSCPEHAPAGPALVAEGVATDKGAAADVACSGDGTARGEPDSKPDAPAGTRAGAAEPSRPVLRRQGAELAAACNECLEDLKAAPDFDAKFLALDSWIRAFDGEPRSRPTPAPQTDTDGVVIVDPVAPPSPEQGVAKTTEPGTLASPASKEETPRPTRPPVEVELTKRFAKYKRLKEAFSLYAEKFNEDAFETVIPSIIQAAAKASDGIPCERAESGAVSMSPVAARTLLANVALLNICGWRDLQKLYLSSARAAPQKLLCLLAYFRAGGEVEHDDRTLTFERHMASSSERDEWDINNTGGPTLAQARFMADFAGAIEGAGGVVLVLSKPGSFGAIADVKTPPEEVPLWEMPELLCVQPLLGTQPLSEGQVAVVRGARRFSRCSAEGPLLNWDGDAQSCTVLDVAGVDLSRHMDDQRFSVETLQRDAVKLATAMRRLGRDHIAVTHPPLLGVDKHLAFAMQLLCASRDGAEVVLHYALGLEYTTGGVRATELSAAQVKEAKHFEALAGRMRSAGWTTRQALGLIALFPFGRSSGEERFHAFWTRRLRDKSEVGGRASHEELETVASRQGELLPPPPPAPDPEPEPVAPAPEAQIRPAAQTEAPQPPPPPLPPGRRDRSRSRGRERGHGHTGGGDRGGRYHDRRSEGRGYRQHASHRSPRARSRRRRSGDRRRCRSRSGRRL